MKILFGTILIFSGCAVLYGYFEDKEGIELAGTFVGVASLLVFAEWAAQRRTSED